MGRKYYKKRVNKDHYSVEQTVVNASIQPATTTTVVVVPDSAVQGVRKVKHLTISCQSPTDVDGVWWALVYCPEGMVPSALNLTTGQSLYEPNQYVMNCGVFDFTSGPVRVSSRVSRNLHSGDRIYLLLYPAGGTPLAISGIVRYAISFN